MVFSSKDSTIKDEDIDRSIEKGEETTAKVDVKMKKFTEDAIKFKMDDTAELYYFDDEKELIALGEVVGTESRGLSADTIASLPLVTYKAQSNQDGSAK
ncbi:hypothetical protein IFM89_033879 [Coptis chinensis]|uniref:Uncharacterized protein n=1 Tax=Coptis chinensis TaxID=261450 RepID=A0A835H461_9MAGN|nr:hypothetical protein IFM89_033879 [Coptis chinensis]